MDNIRKIDKLHKYAKLRAEAKVDYKEGILKMSPYN